MNTALSPQDTNLPSEKFLRGQVALVTGAGKRVGRTLALALAERGATVAVHYFTAAAEARRVVAAIRRKGGTAEAFQADLADDAQCLQLIPQVNQWLGAVRILINSAALFGEGRFETTTLAEWDANLDVNLRAPFRLSQVLAAQQNGRLRGNIIHLSDWRGVRPGTDHFAYTISKAALIRLTQAMALALAPRIRVNCLALGSILPPPHATPRTVQQLVSLIPLKRMGAPKDVAAAVLYLLGPGSFVTGETILVDGGRHLVQ
jgi:NAD(P)-dependent dehydrogenase (short-subunit alcohol dehydrogenase family)